MPQAGNVPRIVDEQVSRILGTLDERGLRLFVASCAERSAQVFCQLQAGNSARAGDLAFFVETIEDLWNLDVPAEAFAERGARLAAFPELEEPEDPGGEQPEAAAETFTFDAVLVLEDAINCARSGDAEKARDAAHMSLTAMDGIDLDETDTRFLEEEYERQTQVLTMIQAGAPATEIREGDLAFARRVAVAAMVV
jgi:hypothetical protein